MSTDAFDQPPRGQWNLKFNAGQVRIVYTTMRILNTLINDTLRIVADTIPDVGAPQRRESYDRRRRRQAHITILTGFNTAFVTIINAAMPGTRYTMRRVSVDELKRAIDSFRKIYAMFSVLNKEQIDDIAHVPIAIELISFAGNVFVDEVEEIMGIKMTCVECSRHGIDCVIV